MASIIIALSTYGSQRVKHPHSGQTISAYKMGYSSAASAVLLALYGDQARDVSSRGVFNKRATIRQPANIEFALVEQAHSIHTFSFYRFSHKRKRYCETLLVNRRYS